MKGYENPKPTSDLNNRDNYNPNDWSTFDSIKPVQTVAATETMKGPGVYEKLKETIGPESTLGKIQRIPAEFAVGAVKQLGKDVISAGQAGGKVIGSLGEKVGIPSFGSQEQIESAKQALEPTGMAQKAGGLATQVAEFATPLGGEKLAATTGMKAAELAPKALKTIAELVPRSAYNALDSAFKTFALSGGDAEQAKQMGLVGAAMPVAGKALSTLGMIGKEMAKTAASRLGGYSPQILEDAFKNPEATEKAIDKFASTPNGERQLLQNTLDAVDVLKEARRKAYQKGLETLEKETMTTKKGQLYVKKPDVISGGVPIWVPTDLSTKGIKNVTTSTMKDFNIGSKRGVLDFTKSILPKSQQNELKEVVSRIYKWDDVTPKGLNNLRQVIDGYKKGGEAQSTADKTFNLILERMRNNLDSYLVERVPQIGAMNKEYALASDTLDRIKDELTLGGKEQTITTKLMNAFNPKRPVYGEVVRELGEKAGVDLMSDIAGLTLSRMTPEGLGSYLTTLLTGAGAALATGDAKAIIPAIGTIAGSSPYLAGKAAIAAGKAARMATPELKAGIQAATKASARKLQE